MDLKKTLERYSPGCEQEAEDRRMMLRYLEAEDILLRSNETAHFTASAWIVNPARTGVLMVFHNIYNSWSWTGGHADGNPDLLSVALREAAEETSLTLIRPVSTDIFSLEILTVNAHFRRGRYVVPHLHLNLTYLLEADDTQAVRSKPDENSAVQWFAPRQAVEASTEPDMRVIYSKLNDRLGSFC